VQPCTPTQSAVTKHAWQCRGLARPSVLSCCLALSLFLISLSHSSPYNTPSPSAVHHQQLPEPALLSLHSRKPTLTPHSPSLTTCDAPCHQTARPFVLAALHRFSRTSIKETFSLRCCICSRRPLDISAHFHQRPLNQVLPSLNHSSTCLQTRWSRASTTSSRPPRPLAGAAAHASPALELDDRPPPPLP
jgi:hypothetical protein